MTCTRITRFLLCVLLSHVCWFYCFMAKWMTCSDGYTITVCSIKEVGWCAPQAEIFGIYRVFWHDSPLPKHKSWAFLSRKSKENIRKFGVFWKTPPLVSRSGLTRGGVFQKGGVFPRNTPDTSILLKTLLESTLCLQTISEFTRFNPWGHALTAAQICCCRATETVPNTLNHQRKDVAVHWSRGELGMEY